MVVHCPSFSLIQTHHHLPRNGYTAKTVEELVIEKVEDEDE